MGQPRDYGNPKVTVSTMIPESSRDRLDSEAKARGETRSELLAKLVEKWLRGLP